SADTVCAVPPPGSHGRSRGSHSRRALTTRPAGSTGVTSGLMKAASTTRRTSREACTRLRAAPATIPRARSTGDRSRDGRKERAVRRRAALGRQRREAALMTAGDRAAPRVRTAPTGGTMRRRVVAVGLLLLTIAVVLTAAIAAPAQPLRGKVWRVG